MKQILIIDDDLDALSPVAEFLRLNGYEVHQAENGRKGLQIFDSRPIDLVLTDIIMPEMEGLETIKDLRKRNPKLKIVAMSGTSPRSPEYLTFAERFGAHRVLLKPFDLQTVLATIQELLAS